MISQFEYKYENYKILTPLTTHYIKDIIFIKMKKKIIINDKSDMTQSYWSPLHDQLKLLNPEISSSTKNLSKI